MTTQAYTIECACSAPERSGEDTTAALRFDGDAVDSGRAGCVHHARRKRIATRVAPSCAPLLPT